MYSMMPILAVNARRGKDPGSEGGDVIGMFSLESANARLRSWQDFFGRESDALTTRELPLGECPWWMNSTSSTSTRAILYASGLLHGLHRKRAGANDADGDRTIVRFIYTASPRLGMMDIGCSPRSRSHKTQCLLLSRSRSRGIANRSFSMVNKEPMFGRRMNGVLGANYTAISFGLVTDHGIRLTFARATRRQ